MHFVIWMWQRDGTCCLQKHPNEHSLTCKQCSGLMHRRGACQFDIFLRATVADHMTSTVQIRVNVSTGVSIKTAENCLFAVRLWTYM